MKVLSLFDGISCAQVALQKAGLKVETYYASEIEKNAISITKKNFPNTVFLGDVTGVGFIEGIDLLIGGSPCLDLSIAKKGREGLKGKHSSLFWEYVRVWKLVKPKWFILENVASMSREDEAIITETLGVEPILINAALVSAQNRKRYFWTNIEGVIQPEDEGILLKDVLQPDAEVDERFLVNGKSFCLTSSYSKVSASPAQVEHNARKKQRTMVKLGHIGATDGQANRVYSTEGKSTTLTSNAGGGGGKTGLYKQNETIRKLTPIECERLQGLPDGYTEGVAMTHRYKCLGNAFNADVVAHILSFIVV
jgi:DNA (cytosine-5)-methyltransferase 3A